MPEAKLAKEAEICYVSVAMVTDYDCWKIETEPVSVEEIILCLNQNVANAKNIIGKAIEMIPENSCWPCHKVLDNAIMTAKDAWPSETQERLKPIIGRLLK